MADEPKAAAYVAFGTFNNAMNSLAQGIPSSVDRSAFSGLSGGVQTQLLSAMKFLGLITDDDKPTPALHAVAVADENKRKEKLKEILQKRYSSIFAMDLMKATPQLLLNKLGDEYGVTGDTRDKAMRFLLAALAYVGIPVSRFFKIPGTTSSNNGTRTRKRSSKAKVTPPAGDPPPANNQTGANTRAVQLASGGTLTLSATVDFLRLSAEDRTFVFSLIDKFDAYGKEVAQVTKGAK